ncbi:hypothetical protein C5167_001588 [Papaver somniferum]|uniref:Rad21/Rec8-like protein N-terminal domain-containing protein n=1 Tax=Papaver somniferum TaxID=3469 RepID=A0A4Y7KZN7_PAPSO|nr:hypothetical protein C5167_001588 [Papaver somniferum]
MFYSHELLARKRPLGTVWMAAHLEKRLRRTHIDVTNIASTVGSFLSYSRYFLYMVHNEPSRLLYNDALPHSVDIAGSCHSRLSWFGYEQ